MKEDPAGAEVETLGEPKKIVKRNKSIFGRDKISLEQLKKKHQHQTVWYQYSPTSEKKSMSSGNCLIYIFKPSITNFSFISFLAFPLERTSNFLLEGSANTESTKNYSK